MSSIIPFFDVLGKIPKKRPVLGWNPRVDQLLVLQVGDKLLYSMGRRIRRRSWEQELCQVQKQITNAELKPASRDASQFGYLSPLRRVLSRGLPSWF